MTKEELLKSIQDLTPSQAYYMGKRDAWAHQLKEDLNFLPVLSGKHDAILKQDYYFIDLYNDCFAKEMGWA